MSYLKYTIIIILVILIIYFINNKEHYTTIKLNEQFSDIITSNSISKIDYKNYVVDKLIYFDKIIKYENTNEQRKMLINNFNITSKEVYYNETISRFKKLSLHYSDAGQLITKYNHVEYLNNRRDVFLNNTYIMKILNPFITIYNLDDKTFELLYNYLYEEDSILSRYGNKLIPDEPYITFDIMCDLYLYKEKYDTIDNIILNYKDQFDDVLSNIVNVDRLLINDKIDDFRNNEIMSFNETNMVEYYNKLLDMETEYNTFFDIFKSNNQKIMDKLKYYYNNDTKFDLKQYIIIKLISKNPYIVKTTDMIKTDIDRCNYLYKQNNFEMIKSINKVMEDKLIKNMLNPLYDIDKFTINELYLIYSYVDYDDIRPMVKYNKVLNSNYEYTYLDIMIEIYICKVKYGYIDNIIESV